VGVYCLLVSWWLIKKWVSSVAGVAGVAGVAECRVQSVAVLQVLQQWLLVSWWLIKKWVSSVAKHQVLPKAKCKQVLQQGCRCKYPALQVLYK
jgi:hypothetical protein